MGGAERIVLLCTSAWQHEAYPGVRGRVAAAVPALLAELVRTLPATVRLVHVGPVGLREVAHALGERYGHVRQLPGPTFRALVAACDLVLTLNASATSNVTALAADVPVVCLQNGWAGPAEGVEAWLGRPLRPAVRAWADQHLPVFRFRMWPLAMDEVLTPVLAGNPYGDLLHLTELLDAEAFETRVHALLHDERTRSDAATARQAYVRTVGALPSGGERLQALLGSA